MPYVPTTRALAVVSVPARSMRIASAVRMVLQGTGRFLFACGLRIVSNIVGWAERADLWLSLRL